MTSSLKRVIAALSIAAIAIVATNSIAQGSATLATLSVGMLSNDWSANRRELCFLRISVHYNESVGSSDFGSEDFGNIKSETSWIWRNT